MIPEPVFTRADYEARILGRIYADLAPLDPEGMLRHEWVNARGAIARFDRGAIEIRVLDVQECPRADLAIAAAVGAVLRALCDAGAPGRAARARRPRRWRTAARQVARRAGDARVDDARLPARARPRRPRALPRGRALARAARGPRGARPLAPRSTARALACCSSEGCLARRILRRAGAAAARERAARVYARALRLPARGPDTPCEA